MLVFPSPKSHAQFVGVPTVASVNAMVPLFEARAKVNAVKGADALTVTLCDVVLLMVPAELLTVSVTVYVPAVKYVLDGFSIALVVPSPKFHAHTVGLPVEVSVKVATCPLVATVNCAAMLVELAAVMVML